MLRVSRFKQPIPTTLGENIPLTDEIDEETPKKRPCTRSIISSHSPSQACTSPLLKICIICNQVTRNKIREKYRISKENRAKQFLAAVKFNKDDVFTRCALFKTVGDIFAADLYSHKKCIQDYIRRHSGTYQFDRVSTRLLCIGRFRKIV